MNNEQTKTNKVIAYARVSTKTQAKDGNSLEAQEQALKAAGATKIYKEQISGTKKAKDRPELKKALAALQPGDTFIVTKLDRLARSVIGGQEVIQDLITRGVTINILNMGILDNSPGGKLLYQMFLAFAEFERDTIRQRTQEGKAIAKQKPGFREGRPAKLTKTDIAEARQKKDINNLSWGEIAKLYGVHRTTLFRYLKQYPEH